MGEIAMPVDGPHPKPSRFQFVPVPGEFSRGRWKCRDSVHPYAETLEFQKSGGKEKLNPDKISVSRKLTRQEAPSDTIQVTSVENNNKEMLDDPTPVDNVVITRKNGVTIVRKSSGSLTPDHQKAAVEKIKEITMVDFENQKNEKGPQVPPTPMNTPPATLGQPGSILTNSETLDPNTLSPTKTPKPKIFQVQAVINSSISQPTRKFSHENPILQQHKENPAHTSFSSYDLGSQTYSATLPASALQASRKFHVQAVNEEELKELADEVKDIEVEPTFQVLQTREKQIMSTDSIGSLTESERHFSGSENLASSEDTHTPVTITLSTERKEANSKPNEAREIASSVSSLDACGIPINGAMPNAPHSTPYGTPKDSNRSPVSVTVEEKIQMNSSVSVPILPSLSAVPATTDQASNMPIDNKIEQAMELVKTHLTYAVREEVDTLKNTIQELEYQMREYQYECNFYRQNTTVETMDQAALFVRQQMQKHQPPPARRSMSTAAVPAVEGSPTSNNAMPTASHSSPHMRNLQNQIQQMK